MSLSSRLDGVATVLMASCALLVTGLYVREKVSSPPDPNTPRPQAAWRDYAVGDMRIGPERAPIVITEFSDFQCPFCLRLYHSLESLRRQYPGRIAIVYRNYPLDKLHPFARPAAIAAECAARVGGFEGFYGYLFEHQDSFATGRWTSFAISSGIRDTSEFGRCLRDPSIASRLRTDSIAAEKLQISGTPTFLVNKWEFGGNPPIGVLQAVIEGELKAAERF